VFKLEVSWHEGFMFFGRNQSAEITVVHIQVQDQAPAQLTRAQVRLLYNAVAGLSPDSVELGFEVHFPSPSWLGFQPDMENRLKRF
jgi:hypothetical protein